MLLALLAYLGGVLTIVSPCILPVLPFVFSRVDRPFLRSTLPILAGMAATFSLVATLAAVGGGWAVAASIAVGIALNVWAMRDERTRDIRLLGAQPPSRRVSEIAEAVRSVTDTQTAALFEERLQAICREQERKSRGPNVWPMLSTQVNSPG